MSVILILPIEELYLQGYTSLHIYSLCKMFLVKRREEKKERVEWMHLILLVTCIVRIAAG